MGIRTHGVQEEHHTGPGKEIWVNSDDSSMFSAQMQVSAPPRSAGESQQIGGFQQIVRPFLAASRGGAETCICAKNIEESSEFTQISFPDPV